MGNVVKLSVHKNTQWKRKQHEISAALMQSARTTARMKGVAGFVLIAWNGEGETSVSCDLSGKTVTPEEAPDRIRRDLIRALNI